MIEENHEKTSVRLVGTGIRTRDLPNASLVRYHGATSLGYAIVFLALERNNLFWATIQQIFVYLTGYWKTADKRMVQLQAHQL